MKLHELRFYEEPCFTGTGAADYQHIFVPCVLWFFWSVRHHQSLCLRQDDVVLKYGIYKRGNILTVSPSGRAVFQIFSELLGILALEIHHKPDDNCGGSTNQQVNRMETRQDIFKRHRNAIHHVQNFGRKINAR